MGDQSKDELLLAMKETLRQAKKMEATEGADAINAAFLRGSDINEWRLHCMITG
jgi:hypothetical protein